jgi:transposase
VRLYETGLLDLQTILDCVGFSKRTFYRILKLWRETGCVARTTIRHGHTRNFDTDDVDYLLRLVHQNPDYFLDELLKLVWTNRFLSMHCSTIIWELE